MIEYKINVHKNRDRHESNGIIYDYIVIPALGFFETDYIDGYYEWQVICDGYITNYRYNPQEKTLQEDKKKISTIISWITLSTLYEHSHKSKDSVYLYGFSIERHSGKSYRLITEVKNKSVYYKAELIEIYIGGQKW